MLLGDSPSSSSTSSPPPPAPAPPPPPAAAPAAVPGGAALVHYSLEGLALHTTVPLHQMSLAGAVQPPSGGFPTPSAAAAAAAARKRPRPRSEEHPPSITPSSATTDVPIGGLLQRLEMLQVSPGCSRRRRAAVRRSGDFGGASGLHRSRSFLHESSLHPVQKSKARSEREAVLKPSKLSKLVASGRHRDQELLKHVRVMSGVHNATATAAGHHHHHLHQHHRHQEASGSQHSESSSSDPMWSSRLKLKARSSSSSSSLSSLRNLEGQQHQPFPAGQDMAFPAARNLAATTLSQSLQDFSKELGTISLDDDQNAAKTGAKKKKKKHNKKHAMTRHNDDESASCSSTHCSEGSNSSSTCAQQARKEYTYNDVSVDDLAGYLEDSIVFPKKMSYMAEMMYT